MLLVSQRGTACAHRGQRRATGASPITASSRVRPLSSFTHLSCSMLVTSHHMGRALLCMGGSLSHQYA